MSSALAVPATWIISVRLAGAELELGDVLADVVIRHGRDDVAASPQPSSASLALTPVDRAFTSSFRVGVELELTASGPGGDWPLFRGVISDAELDHPTLSIVAAGHLASANRAELDVSGWPEEAWSARAARLLAAVPYGALVERDPAFDPILYPPVNLATGTVLFETYAQSLAAAVGAAIVDTADGRLLVQAIGARPSRAAVTHELDPALVAWAPAWLQPLDVVNVVDVQYGPDDATADVVLADQASIDLFERRGTQIQSTRIKTAADASQRAATALERAAYPRWGMRNLLYLEPLLDLAVGDRVLLVDLPASAPSAEWSPVVEGWTHRINGVDWTLELALSDPVSSGLAIVWADVPVAWNQVPPLAWAEADELGDFYP